MPDAWGTDCDARDQCHAALYGQLYRPTGDEMIGVNFQPGGGSGFGDRPKPESNGVQEAIKVLSLRLPKVVGAQSFAPQALLSSPGSGGNPRVDSIVNQVLSRMFPTGGQMPGAQNFGMSPVPQGAPTFSGATPSYQAQAPMESFPKASPFPRVVGDVPPMAPFTGTTPNGRPMATPDSGLTPFPGFPGLVEPAPKRSPFPDYPDFTSYPQEPEPRI